MDTFSLLEDKVRKAASLVRELRQRNAMDTGTLLPTGQAIGGPAPVHRLLEELASMPLPPAADGYGEPDLRELPGGVSNTTHGEGVRRGVGYAAGFNRATCGTLNRTTEVDRSQVCSFSTSWALCVGRDVLTD